MQPRARQHTAQALARAAKASGDLLAEVGQTVRLKRIGQAYNGLCPLHADKNPSLWVYPDGHWHCYGCPPMHNHGSILDWRMALYGESVTAAARAVLHQYGPPPEYAARRPGGAPPDEPDAATQARWDAVYRAAVAQAELAPPEAADLARRGVDRAAATAHGLISMPPERTGWQTRLHQSVAGVPGFSLRDEGTWHGPAGLLIPVRRPDGRMVGAQIRVRQVRTGKYVWWSTPPEATDEAGQPRYPGGAKAWVTAHWAWPGGLPEAAADEVIITEGPLKAIVIAEGTGLPVIGVPGVQAWVTALQALDGVPPPRRVLWALDQDIPPNPAVASALRQGWEALAQAFPGVRQARIVWDGQQAKGFDDVLGGGIAWDIQAERQEGSAR
jgi:DNA primase